MIKQCPSFPGYAVTDDGKVFSFRRRGVRKTGSHGGTVATISDVPQHELRPFRMPKGYLVVSVVNTSGKRRPVGVHQLVADAFIGSAPVGMEVRHLDGNPANNIPSNLQYGTSKDNAADRLRHGTYTSGSRHHNAKLTGSQAESIRALRRAGARIKAIATEFNVSVSTVESIVYGKSYINV